MRERPAWLPPPANRTRRATGTGTGAARERSAPALATERARLGMSEALRRAGVRDAQVLDAMATVPRHRFVDAALASRAYEDVALPIGHGQTISRPGTVARMIELVAQEIPADRRRQARVLEIGTGCGYQAAVLASIFGEVISVERVRGLLDDARRNLRDLRLANLRLVFGDGNLGVPQAAPFDAIVVAAAGEAVSDALLAQMRVGARLIAPIGSVRQSLHLIERASRDDWRLSVLDAVRFVPLRTGTV